MWVSGNSGGVSCMGTKSNMLLWLFAHNWSCVLALQTICNATCYLDANEIHAADQNQELSLIKALKMNGYSKTITERRCPQWQQLNINTITKSCSCADYIARYIGPSWDPATIQNSIQYPRPPQRSSTTGEQWKDLSSTPCVVFDCSYVTLLIIANLLSHYLFVMFCTCKPPNTQNYVHKLVIVAWAIIKWNYTAVLTHLQ